MIYQDIKIENFRGIRLCTLNKLGQVNLFFGKNNCGKSSVLEALFLLTGQSNPTMPVILNNLRYLQIYTEDDMKTVFYRANPQNKIRISSSGEQTREVCLSMQESHRRQISLDKLNNTQSEQSGRFYGYSVEFRKGGDDHVYHSKLVVDENNQGNMAADPLYKESLIGQYLPSGLMQSGVFDKLAEIIKNKEEEVIIDALRIVEPNIKDIQLAGSKVMVDVGLPTRLPINLLGDGIRKVLLVILSIYMNRDGVLMIDEIDNGLHYSVMLKLWNVILKTCRKTNTQLFISTHSLDIVKALVKSLNEQDGNAPAVSSYKLVKKDDDELVALRYGEEQLAYAIEQEMEVR